MKRWGKWGTFALVGVLAVAIAARVVISQQPGGNTPELPSPYAELLEKARPHLEAALGCKLDALPQLSTATPTQIQRVTDPDLDAHLHWHFPHLQGDILQRTHMAARQVV